MVISYKLDGPKLKYELKHNSIHLLPCNLSFVLIKQNLVFLSGEVTKLYRRQGGASVNGCIHSNYSFEVVRNMNISATTSSVSGDLG